MCGMNWFQSRIKNFLFKYSDKTLKMTTGWAGDLLGAVREIYKIRFNCLWNTIVCKWRIFNHKYVGAIYLLINYLGKFVFMEIW